MNVPDFTIDDLDERLTWFSDTHPDYSSDRKQVGRMAIHTIYNRDGKELGLIRIYPGTGQSREVQIGICYKAGNVNKGSGGPWYWFGSLSDPKSPSNKQAREFCTFCALFWNRFTMTHLLDRAGRRLEGYEFMDQGGASDRDTKGRKAGRKPDTAEQWKEKFEQVQKVLQMAETRDISERNASELEGIPYSTFRSWKRRMSYNDE